MSCLDASTCSLDDRRRLKRLPNRLQQLDQLRKRERMLDSGVPIDGRRVHVPTLEPQYQVDALEIDLGYASRAVFGEVEPKRPCDVERLRESSARAEIDDP